jgi:hypothetical protein
MSPTTRRAKVVQREQSEQVFATLYVYRYCDGKTQVRSPDCDDAALVIDMLEEALRAMRDGTPVRTQ